MSGEDWEHYSEDDVRIRANPRGSRPRSKRRPEYRDAPIGMVIAVDRRRYQVALPGQSAPVTAMSARELDRIVVGDEVALDGDVSGAAGTLARIVRIEPRRTLLRRSADDALTGERDERIIVANADRMLIVVAAADPEPRVGLVDRILLAAIDAGVEPTLVVTKCDLANPEPFIAEFAGLGPDGSDLDVVRSRWDDVPLAELQARIDGGLAVLVGHSGVGKSTLVNALVPEAERAIGDVNAVTGRGRHTSTSSRAFRAGEGWIVDTPGVRSFGLSHLDPERIRTAVLGRDEAAMERLLSTLRP